MYTHNSVFIPHLYYIVHYLCIFRTMSSLLGYAIRRDPKLCHYS